MKYEDIETIPQLIAFFVGCLMALAKDVLIICALIKFMGWW